MIRLSSKITIDKYILTAVHAVEIESSWSELTDVCTIKLPRKVSWKGRALATGSDPIFKRGMKVKVELGYDDKLTEVFRGYIRDISAKIPIEIKCEDEMYLLKQGSFTKSYKSVSLSTLVGDMLKAIGSTMDYKVIGNQQLGQLRLTRVTPAQVLDELKDKYYIRSWCRNGVLYVGWVVVPELQRDRIFSFQQHIVSDDLSYRIKDDIKINLTGVIMYPDNKKVELKEGEPEGEQRTFHKYNISKDGMRKLMKEEIERMRYTGYRGGFTTFGAPDVRHGDRIEVVDNIYPERAGKVLCSARNITFGMDGYRQEIKLDAEV